MSDVDVLITSLDALIAKKRAVKQGTMQQLLTGKKRLPGFTGEWETKTLGEIADIDPENLGAGTKSDYTFYYISLENVERGTLISKTEYKFSFAPSRARRIVRKGDALIGTVLPNLQSHLYINVDARDTICSTGFLVIRCNELTTSSLYIY